MADDEPSIVPALPPLPGVAIPPENRAPGTPTTLADATPPPLSNIPLQQQGSGVSSLTNALTAASASTHDDRDIDPTPKKGKRKFPDFSRPTSLDNPDLSGDDSDGWIEEEEAINERISADNAAERELADNTMDDPLEEIQDWEYVLEGVETAPNTCGNEGEQRGEGGNVGVGRFDLITVSVKTHSLADLKKICKALNLSITGTKPVLFKRLRDSGREAIERIDDDTLRYRQPVDGEAPDLTLPRWVILNPDPVADIEGIDMLRGAQHGFFGPTNIENAVGAPKWQYLCREEEKIRRPQFASKKNPAHPISEMGHMSDDARDLLPEFIRDCRPKQFFNTQISHAFVKRCIVDTTNARAAAEGAGFGGTVYSDYVPFDVEEMYKMMGLLLVNGVCPRPGIHMWFERHPIFGNEFISNALKKQGRGGERAIRGFRRWKHFRRFMCMFDFRRNIKQETAKNPLFKVQHLLDELNENAAKMWIPGKWLAIDEQTLGFQGRSSLKLRISYKSEGDGFQCDAICDDGYTYSFFFRHGDAPPLPDLFKEKVPDLSPTAARVVWLALRLPNIWSRIYMDNLFNSRKLFTALYLAKALAHGVVRTTGRGLPPSVRQVEEKNVREAQKVRGRTAAAKLINSPECPDLLACSVYDTKPVHMISMTEESIWWVLKKRKVWSAIHQQIKEVGFLRLNLIDQYNSNMNSVDVADQLRNQYRPDHWMRNRKWWWAFFIWGLGVATTNAYKMYCSMYDKEKARRAQRRRNSGGMPKKWTHLEFQIELIYDLLYPGQTDVHLQSISELDDRSIDSTRTLTSFESVPNQELDERIDLDSDNGRANYLRDHNPTIMTKNTMITNKPWRRRFDGLRHASLPVTGKHCQYCYYQYMYEFNDAQKKTLPWMERNRKHVRRCLVCNVNLCEICEIEFHGVRMCETAKLLGK